MKLSSPDYPKEYKADGMGCDWLISAPEGFIIALEFHHFHVSNLLDFLRNLLYTGSSNSASSLSADLENTKFF